MNCLAYLTRIVSCHILLWSDLVPLLWNTVYDWIHRRVISRTKCHALYLKSHSYNINGYQKLAGGMKTMVLFYYLDPVDVLSHLGFREFTSQKKAVERSCYLVLDRRTSLPTGRLTGRFSQKEDSNKPRML